MIAVSGAAGKTGRAICTRLVAYGRPVRALVRRQEQIQPLYDLGVTQVVCGDMRDPQAVTDLLVGAEKLYHICSNMNPQEVIIGELFIAAARQAGVEHFVYHSVLHPQVEAMPHHWLKMRVEEKLFESGLAVTILQPAAYYQNLLGYWQAMVTQGVYGVPYSIEVTLSMVDLEDVAEAAARILNYPGHAYAVYELSGPRAVSAREIAELVSERTGKVVRAQTIERGEWEAGARSGGLPDYAVDTLLKMFAYYEKFGFHANSNVLAWLLGRQPTSIESFIDRQI